MPSDSEKTGREAAELLGQLARELSALVRRDVEVAAAERLPALRRALLDVAAVRTVGVAGLFALAALSVATGWALASVAAGWTAALFVAGAWALIALLAAAVLLRPGAHRREREDLLGLLQLLSGTRALEQVQSAREDARDAAEAKIRETSAALVRTLLEEAAERQLKALPALAKRELDKAEPDAAPLLAGALALLTAPARAGLGALGRLAEPRDAATRTAGEQRRPSTN
jgi:hypothetical protein